MFKNKLKISYYGATKTEDGIGLASKLHLEALKKNNSKNNLLIKEYILSRNVGYQKYTNLISEITIDNLYYDDSQINYFHFSPRWINKYLGNKERLYLKEKINIGYWVCEAQKIPENWIQNIDFFNEIWTASDFCKKVYEKQLNIPVKVINHPVAERELSQISNPNKNTNHGWQTIQRRQPNSRKPRRGDGVCGSPPFLFDRERVRGSPRSHPAYQGR